MSAFQRDNKSVSSSGDASERFSQYRVLVVEDEEEVRRLSTRIVEHCLSCEVVQAVDGDAGLAEPAKGS